MIPTRGVAMTLLRSIQTTPRSTPLLRFFFSTPSLSSSVRVSNLKIDPRSSFAPLYNANRDDKNHVVTATVDAQEQLPQDDDEEVDLDSTTAEESVSTEKLDNEQQQQQQQHNHDDDEDDEEDYDDDDDDDDDDLDDLVSSYHDTTSDRTAVAVIPLPDRLHTSVYNKLDASEVVGTLYLNDLIFGHDAIRIDLLQRAVEHHRACVRGKRKAITKTISQVSGSGRKVRPQKGSGRARAGHGRPAHWRGGAKAHGPKGSIQDYGARKLNKRVRKMALTHALSQKLKEGNIVLLNDFNLKTHKTNDLAKLLQAWNVGGRNGTSALILDHVEQTTTATAQDEDDATAPTSIHGLPIHLVVAAGNMHSVKVLHQVRANVYSILKHEKLILTVSAVEALEERLVQALS